MGGHVTVIDRDIRRLAEIDSQYKSLITTRFSNQTNIEEEVVSAMSTIRDVFGVKPGSRVVITAGLRARKRGSTNVMEIREVPRNGSE